MNTTADKIWSQFSQVINDISISEDFAKDIADALNQTEKKAHRTTDLQVAGRDNREDLVDQLASLQKSLTSAVLETAKTVLEFATTAKSHWISASAQTRRDFLDKVLSNPILDGVTVRYELKKPFAVLLEMSKNENWRPLVPRLRTELLEM